MATGVLGAAIQAAPKSKTGLSPEHADFLSGRGIAGAALWTGVHTGKDNRGKTFIRFPYPRGYEKRYTPGAEDGPWRQKKPKAARLSLWRLEEIDFNRDWVLTEGEFDALSAIECGFPNSTTLPDGAVGPDEETPAKSGKLVSIRSAWDRINAGRGRVILALDNDDPGEVTRDILIDIFGRWRCKLVEYPEHPQAGGKDGKCKDLNEVQALFGLDKVWEIIDRATPLKLEGVFKLSEIKKSQPREYYSTGIEGLDEHLKLFKGELCVWTGHTGHGKSTSLLNCLGNLAKQGLQIGLGAFEADVWEDLHEWYHTWLFGESKNEQSYSDTSAWLEEHFTFIAHDIEPLQSQATIEWFIQQGQDAKGRYGIDVLVCEPWNKLQHRRAKFESEPDYIGRALSELRNFARCNSIIGIVSAHPTKEAFQADKVQLPNLAQIHGSMNWGNMADHVVCAYRPDMELTSTCIATLKSRFKKGGKVGHKWYVFSEETNRYRPLAAHLTPKMGKPLETSKSAGNRPAQTTPLVYAPGDANGDHGGLEETSRGQAAESVESEVDDFG